MDRLHKRVGLSGHYGTRRDYLIFRRLPGFPQAGKCEGLFGLEEDVSGFLLLSLLPPLKEAVSQYQTSALLEGIPEG